MPVLVMSTVPNSLLNGLVNRLVLVASAIAAYSGLDLDLLRTVQTDLHNLSFPLPEPVYFS